MCVHLCVAGGTIIIIFADYRILSTQALPTPSYSRCTVREQNGGVVSREVDEAAKSKNTISGACIPHLTESVKSPGHWVLGRTRKLPCFPFVRRSSSASFPDKFGWNHLGTKVVQVGRF